MASKQLRSINNFVHPSFVTKILYAIRECQQNGHSCVVNRKGKVILQLCKVMSTSGKVGYRIGHTDGSNAASDIMHACLQRMPRSRARFSYLKVLSRVLFSHQIKGAL